MPPTFDFDRNVLEDAFRQHPKAIIVCNPSNPCGKVFTREELLFIGGLCNRYDAYMITDEVYEHIVFAPWHHVYAGSLPEIADRVICCSSLSKTYSITGWRLGYLIGPGRRDRRRQEGARLPDRRRRRAPSGGRRVGLEFPQSYYDGLTELYTHKRKVFLDGLDRIGLKHTVPQGSYFVLVDTATSRNPVCPLPARATWNSASG